MIHHFPDPPHTEHGLSPAPAPLVHSGERRNNLSGHPDTFSGSIADGIHHKMNMQMLCITVNAK